MELTHIWEKFEKIKEQHNKVNLNNKSEKCWDFFNGRQWRNIGSGINEAELPFYNFIQPTVEYKVATVAQQDMTITFSPMGTVGQEFQKICDVLNEFVRQQYELLKMETKCWEVVKEACVVGDSYIYFYNEQLHAQIIDNINIFLADEQETDIQKQKFIILHERRNVSDVKKEAEQNGIDERDIDSIVADDDTDNLTTEAKNEVQNTTDGKCTCLLMLKKDENGIVTVTRSTKTVIYQQETKILGQNEDGTRSVALKVYPIVNFIWSKKKGSSRGLGEVEQLIPNQIAVNKNLARREESIKQVAFPKIVYNSQYIANTNDLDSAGAKIEVQNSSLKINEIIDYLRPQQLSADAKQFNDEMLQTTRDLAGAGDSAIGNVDPTKASGTAIIAVQDQSAIPLNEQKAIFKQFIEDIALVWYQMWIAYNPQGIEVPFTEKDELGEEYETTYLIATEALQEMKVNIKIDVAPNNPFSKYAQQQAIDNLFGQGHISLEEYVELLDDNSSVPKGRLKAILDKRVPQVPLQMGGDMNVLQQM